MDDVPPPEPGDATQKVERTQWQESAATKGYDTVVREEPLEIRVGGVALAVIMRTPGHDIDLVRGFMVTERVIGRMDQIASIRHCDTVDVPEAENNAIQVILSQGVTLDLARLRRNLYASSSCGICGKATIENALSHAPAVPVSEPVSAQVLYRLPGLLKQRQTVFEQTGGLHAAGLFDPQGNPLVVREDVGRHNAVDKVIGHAFGSPTLATRQHTLMVSGRVSYEIVQKALAARIPVVAAVSAPSSLAIDLARASNMTLVAFVRGCRAVFYAGADRVLP